MTYAVPVFQKITVLFISLFAGYISRKAKIIHRDTTKSLSAFLAYVTNTCLYICILQVDYDTEKLKKAAQVFILSIIIHSLTAIFSHLIFKRTKKPKQRVVYEFALMYDNCGYMGFPLILSMSSVFGQDGLFYGVIYASVFNLFCWSHGICLMNSSNEEKNKLNWKKIFFNPGMLSILVGLSLFLLKIRIPTVLYDGLTLVGDMTFPLAMIIIGSLLADINLLKVFKEYNIYLFALLKLLALPLITLTFVTLFKLPSYLAIIGVTMTAIPPAANTVVLSELYDNDSFLAAKLVGIPTLLSSITLPIMLMLTNMFS